MQEELANPAANESAPEPVPKENRGWFRPGGDRRINREGRPRGSKRGCPQGKPLVDRAPRADRLMVMVWPLRDLAWRLQYDLLDYRGLHPRTSEILNLPQQFEIVASRVDVSRDALLLVFRSQRFPRIAGGAPIPEFGPVFRSTNRQRS